MPGDQTIRIFICSDFRDMSAERGYLHASVFPVLRERWAGHAQIVVMDPLQGLRSADEADDDALLEDSLQQIDQGCDLFVVLLGERYGRPIAAVSKRAFQRGLALSEPGLSRIGVETSYGGLRDAAACGVCYAYFRQPQFLSRVPPLHRAELSEDGPSSATKLGELKATLRSSARVAREYDCEWDAHTEHIAGLEEFGRAVLDDLHRAIVHQLKARGALIAAGASSAEHLEEQATKTGREVAAAVPVVPPTPSQPVDAGPQVSVTQIVSLHTDGTPEEYFPILKDTTSIGRRAADIACADDPYMADSHASIVKRGDGYVVEDTGLGSGVWIRTQVVDGHPLGEGDLVWVGAQILMATKDGDRWVLAHYNSEGVYQAAYPIGERGVLVGRSTDVALDSQDMTLARRQAQFRIVDGTLNVFDLASTNGTYVRVTAPVALKSGDEFRAGSKRFRFETFAPIAKLAPTDVIVEAPQAPAPAAPPRPAPPAKGLDDDHTLFGTLKVATPSEEPHPKAPYLDENVQFTLYRPRVMPPQEWYPFLAFAHLSERRRTASADEPDPIKEMERQAEQILSEKLKAYGPLTEDSAQSIPREGELTFVPVAVGLEFNPPRSSFLWEESVHRQEFRVRAAADMGGQTARGRLSVFLGSILLAEIGFSIRVDRAAEVPERAPEMHVDAARAYRKIFASYSRLDAAIVEQFEHYARVLGDDFMRDVTHIRTGEVWSRRLEDLINEADIFQLFWSSNSMCSPFVRHEWEYALALQRPDFVRPTYWEKPQPSAPSPLSRLEFQEIPASILPAAGVAPASATGEPGSRPAATSASGIDHTRGGNASPTRPQTPPSRRLLRALPSRTDAPSSPESVPDPPSPQGSLAESGADPEVTCAEEGTVVAADVSSTVGSVDLPMGSRRPSWVIAAVLAVFGVVAAGIIWRWLRGS